MRHRMLMPIAVAILSGCTDQTPTGPQAQVGGAVHFGAFAGANGKIVFASNRDPGGGILTMNPDGSNVQTVTPEGSGPAWSPNGTRIVFVRFDGNDNEIFVMNADGTGITQLTSNTADDQGPTWSSDGTKIGYHSNVTGTYQIYTINANTGGTPTPLTSSGGNFAAAWSSNGTKIAFTSTRDAGDLEIYVMDADGSNQTRLTNDVEWDYDPTWSPDGSRIAFTRGANIPDIYAMDANGSNPTNLTNSPNSADVTASWSPDGTKIVFIGVVGENSDVVVMNANGSGQTNISNNPASETLPDWQRLPSGPTVRDRVQSLLTRLNQLALPKGTVSPLKTVLNDVIAALDANNTPQACSSLADFISKVKAQSGKKIPADVAADLVRQAEAAAAQLGCVPGAKCYPDLPAPQLVLQSTTPQTSAGVVQFELDVPNYVSFPNELFAAAPDLAPCGLNTSASRTWVDILDGNGNFLYGFCSFRQASDLNGLWFQTTIAQWPAEAYIKLTDRRCNITYTSNRINLAQIF